jgi:MoaA/NifB/PqqE/SkfB family radical SAM enzyme
MHQIADRFPVDPVYGADVRENCFQKTDRIAKLRAGVSDATRLLKGRVPGQLVIQFTDHCNAQCPQCGMRVTNRFPRTSLSDGDVKQLIDAAADKGYRVVSFTGGEPLLFADKLCEYIRYAREQGLEYTRTGTNGFLFARHSNPNFYDRMHQLARNLKQSGLRNFWISVDSADPDIHEQMRGLDGVIQGIEKALPVFHEHGLYPSANLGLNRNTGGKDTFDLNRKDFTDNDHYLLALRQAFRRGVERFYTFVGAIGFTMVNTCYPMSVESSPTENDLDAVYAATSSDRVIRFDRDEKGAIFQGLLDTIPAFRSKIRIFSPLVSLYALVRHYRDDLDRAYPCRGGIDFFFVNANGTNVFPCGYRGHENMGELRRLQIKAIPNKAHCKQCDWECFRDPSELFGPILEGLRRPITLSKKFHQDPRYMKLWLSDLTYYRACHFFDGRRPPDYRRMRRFK